MKNLRSQAIVADPEWDSFRIFDLIYLFSYSYEAFVVRPTKNAILCDISMLARHDFLGT